MASILVASGVQANAQTVGIAAVVNDEIVSAYDVRQRQDVTFSTAGIKPTEEARRRSRAQILRTLISEKLQLQEAKRLNISIKSSDIERGKRQIEKQNKLKTGAFSNFMRQRGLPEAAVLAQMRSEIAWTAIMRTKLAPKIQISDEEVQEVIARFEKIEGLLERQVAEIYLPVDSLAQEAEVARTANRLIEQMKKGSSFAAVARQFSQSTTASNGGVVGWVMEGQLAPEIENALAKTNVGQVTNPIRTPEGYYIMFLRKIRRIGLPDIMAAKVTLKQIALPLSKDITGPKALAVKAKIDGYAKNLDSCSDIDQLIKEIDLPGSGELGTLKIGDLPRKFRSIVSELEIGKPSISFRTDQGFHVLVVCNRVDAKAYKPTADAISRSLGEQRMNMLARRYMRDLRRTAVIDLR